MQPAFGVPMEPERFVTAQERDFDQALAELRQGAKRSHWIWYVFPQHAALGQSDTAKYYGLDGLADAREYLDHPVLGPRLRQAVDAALASGERDPVALFGELDAMKFRSSMTLFAEAAGAAGVDPAPFRRALDAFYDGERDGNTLELIAE